MVFNPGFENHKKTPQPYVDGYSDSKQYRDERYEVYKTPEQKRIAELEAKNAKLLEKTREYLRLLEKFEDLVAEIPALSAKEKWDREEKIYYRSSNQTRNSKRREKRVDKAYWKRRSEQEKNSR